ncbi:unnamed protein product [Enterobius vermicularis]|uniref:RH1 domain-containing protein n=1 Tax=Enterobius vermicularis TaxID=51028 RepID=A0A0N4VQ30_ENTVE|nr:unnamed protein product [Enterobius vermicularis]
MDKIRRAEIRNQQGKQETVPGALQLLQMVEELGQYSILEECIEAIKACPSELDIQKAEIELAKQSKIIRDLQEEKRRLEERPENANYLRMEVILRKLEEKLQEEEREKPEVEQKTQDYSTITERLMEDIRKKYDENLQMKKDKDDIAQHFHESVALLEEMRKKQAFG